MLLCCSCTCHKGLFNNDFFFVSFKPLNKQFLTWICPWMIWERLTDQREIWFCELECKNLVSFKNRLTLSCPVFRERSEKIVLSNFMLLWSQDALFLHGPSTSLLVSWNLSAFEEIVHITLNENTQEVRNICVLPLDT
jgi:hypothetical protein